MTDKESVLKFVETNMGPRKVLPQVCTVTRTTRSKYLFYLAVRLYRKKLKLDPIFWTYTKQDAGRFRASIEESNVFNAFSSEQKSRLFVLEGFPHKLIKAITVPEGTYICAEVDEGELDAPVYRYKNRRDILTVLVGLFKMKSISSKRALIGKDWTSLRSYEEIESLMRKAKIMSWNEDEIGDSLGRIQTGNLLASLKSAKIEEILGMIEKYGVAWGYNHIVSSLVELIQFKCLKGMGYDEKRCMKEMDLSWYRMEDLRKSDQMLTMEEVTILSKRVVGFHSLCQRNPSLGLELFILNSPVRVGK